MSIFETDEVVLLTQGTIEYLMVDVVDLAEEVTDLNGTSPRFDVENPAGVLEYSDEPALVDPLLPLRVRCLVDTTTWEAGDYKLFIHFDTLPEVPRLGPFYFGLIA